MYHIRVGTRWKSNGDSNTNKKYGEKNTHDKRALRAAYTYVDTIFLIRYARTR